MKNIIGLCITLCILVSLHSQVINASWVTPVQGGYWKEDASQHLVYYNAKGKVLFDSKLRIHRNPNYGNITPVSGKKTALYLCTDDDRISKVALLDTSTGTCILDVRGVAFAIDEVTVSLSNASNNDPATTRFLLSVFYRKESSYGVQYIIFDMEGKQITQPTGKYTQWKYNTRMKDWADWAVCSDDKTLYYNLSGANVTDAVNQTNNAAQADLDKPFAPYIGKPLPAPCAECNWKSGTEDYLAYYNSKGELLYQTDVKYLYDKDFARYTESDGDLKVYQRKTGYTAIINLQHNVVIVPPASSLDVTEEKFSYGTNGEDELSLYYVKNAATGSQKYPSYDVYNELGKKIFSFVAEPTVAYGVDSWNADKTRRIFVRTNANNFMDKSTWPQTTYYGYNGEVVKPSASVALGGFTLKDEAALFDAAGNRVCHSSTCNVGSYTYLKEQGFLFVNFSSVGAYLPLTVLFNISKNTRFELNVMHPAVFGKRYVEVATYNPYAEVVRYNLFDMETGKDVLPQYYDGVTYFGGSVITYENLLDGIYTLVDLATGKTLADGYKTIIKVSETRAEVITYEGTKLYINPQGQVIP